MERNRVLEITPERRAQTALASKRVADMIVLMFLDEKGCLELNEVFNGLINGICQISVKCSSSPDQHEELIGKFMDGMADLMVSQVTDWDSVKDTVEQSAHISYAAMVNMSQSYVKEQN